jgi:hypothetical protein
VDLVKPTVVRIVLHVTGEAKVAPVEIDLAAKTAVADAAAAQASELITVNEYLAGSGFVIHPDGYIATNAHVVSGETVKHILASESAMAGMYSAALRLSEEEMDEFLRSPEADTFVEKALAEVIAKSGFRLRAEVFVLSPQSTAERLEDLLKEALPAEVVAVNDSFIKDDRDVALLKIAAAPLPALRLDGEGLSVGKRAFIFGFPATAELNAKSPLEATFSQGVVSAIKTGSDDRLPIYQTDAKVSAGSSGGPLFNEFGEAVGMVTFQTDEMNRTEGDNFAFAIPISLVREMAEENDVPIASTGYYDSFAQGLALAGEKHCARALERYEAARVTNATFPVERYIAPYERECNDLRVAGRSIDTAYSEWKERATSLGMPVLSLIGALLFAIVFLVLSVFWLVRQIQREESELIHLRSRVTRDERQLSVAYRHAYGTERVRAGEKKPEDHPGKTYAR